MVELGEVEEVEGGGCVSEDRRWVVEVADGDFQRAPAVFEGGRAQSRERERWMAQMASVSSLHRRRLSFEGGRERRWIGA